MARGRARLRRRGGRPVPPARAGRRPRGHAGRRARASGSPCWCTTEPCSTIPRWSRRSPPRRGSPSATCACRPRCAHASSSSRPRAAGSSRRRTRSAGGWSASCSEGAERRLRAVSAHVEALAAEVDEPRARELLAEVEDAAARRPAAELSELARGIHPPALDDRRAGGGAARARRAAAPIPVELRVDGGRCPGRGRGGRVLRLRRGADERREVRAGVARRGSRCAATRPALGRDRRRRRRRRRPGPRIGPARARRSRRGARRAVQRREPARGGHAARRRDPGP